MVTSRRILSLLVLTAAISLAGCSAQQASHKTSEVSNQTAGTLDSVFDGVKAVVVYPFHLIGDLFS